MRPRGGRDICEVIAYIDQIADRRIKALSVCRIDFGGRASEPRAIQEMRGGFKVPLLDRQGSEHRCLNEILKLSLRSYDRPQALLVTTGNGKPWPCAYP